MPRRARIKLAGITRLLIHRGNNGARCFLVDDDYRYYLHTLSKGAQRYECAIHAYVLMPNHVHMLLTPQTEDGPSRMMRYLGSRYVKYFNNVRQRTGTLWEGRYKSSLIDTESYLLTSYRFIELNPVRWGMVDSPGKYTWSSYAAHALGEKDSMLREHRIFLALGDKEETRQAAYRNLFRDEIDSGTLQSIRESIHCGNALGRERFKDEIEGALGRRVRPGERGRPKKQQQQAALAGQSGTAVIKD